MNTKLPYWKIENPLVFAALVFVFLLMPLSGKAAELVECAGTTTVTFAPGMTNSERDVDITVDRTFSPCLHLLPLPLRMPATSHAQFQRTQQCQTLLGGGPGSDLIRWSNGDTSLWNWVSVINVVNGNLVVEYTGTIDAGRYAGQSVLSTLVLTPLLAGQPMDFLAACASAEGLTLVEGAFSFIVLP